MKIFFAILIISITLLFFSCSSIEHDAHDHFEKAKYYFQLNDFENTEIVNYDNPMELWNALSKPKKIRLSLKGVKGMVKNTLF